MKNNRMTVVALLGTALLAGCGGEQAQQRQTMGRDGAPIAMWEMNTSSDEARQRMQEGQYELDVGEFGVKVYEHFRLALEADPNFALGQLMASWTALSLEEGRAHLARAEALADEASQSVQLLIQITRRQVENDEEGALELAQELIALDGENPRNWLVLADIQSDIGRIEEGRKSRAKALELAPNLIPGHIAQANSYIFVRPVDFAKADEHVRQAISLAPDEPFPYDLLGDLHRAQGLLKEAGEAYTQAAERDPSAGFPLQQRGHVNSFLENYDQARADYDASISLSRGNLKAAFAVYRALVHVHAGDPQGAIEELDQLYEAVDGMGVPDPNNTKLFALTEQLTIALHHGQLDVAERAAERAAAIWRKTAEQVGTESFRRAQEANIAYAEGRLAARKGDYALATQKAQEFMEHVEPMRTPTKNLRAHQLLGLVALLQEDYEGAVEHYSKAIELETGVAQQNTDAHLNYYYALALEGAGRTADAQEYYRRAANNYFNDAGAAVVHEAARAKLSS